MTAPAYDYKGLRVITYPGRAPLTGSKTIHGSLDQIWWRSTLIDSVRCLFWWFSLILNGFRRRTTSIGFLMKLYFHPYVDRRKRSPDASWVTSLRQTGPGGRGRLEFMLDRASGLFWTSLLVIFASISSSKFLMTLSNIPKKYSIIR
jgi:hypothetical protein